MASVGLFGSLRRIACYAGMSLTAATVFQHGTAWAEKSKSSESKSGVKSMQELFYQQLLARRIIMVNGRIDESLAERVVGQLLYLQMQNGNEPVTMLINSGGGAVHSAMAIHDVMQQISAPVHTTCYGRAESAASILLSAGEKGQRCISPMSRVMIHQPSRSSAGKSTAKDSMVAATELDRLNTQLAKLLSDHSGTSLEEILALFTKDTYLTANDAIKKGIVDKICTNPLLGAVDEKTTKVEPEKAK
eukprot:m.326452 g.326452  ORF g.326452 m.326452 type:complete len:247 (+) comp16558_c1_seq12:951-1691(+)